MALKLTVIIAMLAGLVTYAQSAGETRPWGASRTELCEQLKRAGYVKVDQASGPKGLIVETFELRTPSKPHCHLTAWMFLTSRGDDLISFAHDECYADVAD
jgi:hypothetical protein